MINISTQLPAVWTPQAAQAPAAVAAVAPIRPVQESGRNGQSGAGADPETQASRQGRRRPESESAPILPRRSGQEEDSTGAVRSTSTAQAERLSQADAEQHAEQEAAQQAAEKAQKFGVKEVEVRVKGPGSGRESAITSLQGGDGNQSVIFVQGLLDVLDAANPSDFNAEFEALVRLNANALIELNTT